MPDVIKLLPDSVANQIAAGEVIQRPASVVKELAENSVDAGASEIIIVVRDAGKTMIQVADNGSGMSETDARLSFERHATSKISSAADLFAISTKGFRGEALASIAAVAMVELRTGRWEDETGTRIIISGSRVETQEPCSSPRGSIFTVKNLFYNVPARRKFLKTESTELRHIITEFQKIALAHPGIKFTLHHNDSEIYNLHSTNHRQRIVTIFGKTMSQSLVGLSAETSIVNVSGFIGKPEFARKSAGEQFFFVNGRFMRHAYFHKAVLEAFHNLLPPETTPSYFIYLDADPGSIDVNIHPTKTEIKFEDERAIWQIIHATVRESLGRFNVAPSIDFGPEGMIDIPVTTGNDTFPHQPDIRVNTSFNPFDSEDAYRSQMAMMGVDNPPQWHIDKSRNLYGTDGQNADTGHAAAPRNFFNLKNRYILSPAKSGLMIIDQKRAHERILFEEYLRILKSAERPVQKTIFPVTIELGRDEMLIFEDIMADLQQIGYDISVLNPTSIAISGHPGELPQGEIKNIIESFISGYRETLSDPSLSEREKVAASLARASAIPYGRSLTAPEMEELFDRLFACSAPNYSPSGKPVLVITPIDEIDKKFK
ncbi:MAG: DNA mismatch repair endonuclease MutL [Bacteroidales bacterium]|jgi:DNA mismatch repair protein MutL|nr:DNA mismatch repair endonuclease MutL [Bacteroidales bacterium]